MENLYIREHGEGGTAYIERLSPERGEKFKNVISKDTYNAYKEARWIIRAFNEGGHACTEVDLIDLLSYVKANMPEIWKNI